MTWLINKHAMFYPMMDQCLSHQFLVCLP